MAHTEPLILGLDLGTSSVKVAIVTCTENPNVLINNSHNFGNTTFGGSSAFGNSCQRNESEQDVSKVFHCIHLLISRISPELLSRVVAIVVTGQMHGVMGWIGGGLAFDKESKILKNRLELASTSCGCGTLITWLDRRCNREFLESLPKSEASETPSSGFGCASILWHTRHNTGEFAMNPVSSVELEIQFEKCLATRKISVGSHLIRTVSNDRFKTDKCQEKNRSVSQIQSPPMLFFNKNLHANQHPAWTCTGTIADFLVAGLTDLKKPVMSPQMANSWGYFDINKECWDIETLEKAGFPLHLLPEIRPAGSLAGQLTFDWEGIPSGADVFVALGDLQCSVYPFLTETGNAACNLSTSAQIAFRISSKMPTSLDGSGDREGMGVFGRQLRTHQISIWPFFEGERVVVAASLNGGNVIDRFVKMLRRWCKQLGLAALDDAQVYAKLTQAAEHIRSPPLPPPPMSTSSLTSSTSSCSTSPLLMCITPRLFGERHAPDDTASVESIHPDQLNLEQVYASLCEGIIRNLVSMAPEELLQFANIKRVFCCGGALKRNPLLQHYLTSEYSSLECLPDKDSVEACVGAAIFTCRQILLPLNRISN